MRSRGSRWSSRNSVAPRMRAKAGNAALEKPLQRGQPRGPGRHAHHCQRPAQQRRMHVAIEPAADRCRSARSAARARRDWRTRGRRGNTWSTSAAPPCRAGRGARGRVPATAPINCDGLRHRRDRRRRQQALHRRDDPGEIGVTAAEVARPVEVGAKERDRFPVARVARKILVRRIQTPRLEVRDPASSAGGELRRRGALVVHAARTRSSSDFRSRLRCRASFADLVLAMQETVRDKLGCFVYFHRLECAAANCRSSPTAKPCIASHARSQPLFATHERKGRPSTKVPA